MTTIDLIPINPPENEHASPQEEAGAAVSEPAGNQAEEPSEQSQKISSPEEVESVKKQAVPEAQPKEKAKRGRPPGSKNKTPWKAMVKPEPVEPLTPVKEKEIIEEPPPAEEPVISPRMQKKELLRQMAARRQEERKAKMAHYTSRLDRSLGYNFFL